MHIQTRSEELCGYEKTPPPTRPTKPTLNPPTTLQSNKSRWRRFLKSCQHSKGLNMHVHIWCLCAPLCSTVLHCTTSFGIMPGPLEYLFTSNTSPSKNPIFLRFTFFTPSPRGAYEQHQELHDGEDQEDTQHHD